MLRLHAEYHAFQDLLTFISILDLLCRNAEYALFVQQQLQQSVKPGKYTQIYFRVLYDSLLTSIAAAGHMAKASAPQ